MKKEMISERKKMKKLIGLIGLMLCMMMGVANANTYSFHSDATAPAKKCFYHGDPLPDTRRECFYHGDVDYPWVVVPVGMEKKEVVTTSDFKWWEGLQILLGMGDE